MAKFTTIFVDIGGVLLTNGWDRVSRKNAALLFGLDWEDFEERHSQVYNLYEIDTITIDDYLSSAVFWKKRDFSVEKFKEYMYSQSKPHPEMIKLIQEIKQECHLKVAAVSNEGRDLADYRIKQFKLAEIIDNFFVSCYVHYQKPNPHIYQLALDVMQVLPEQVYYIDDRANLVEAASRLGIRGLIHTSLETTRKQLLTHLVPKVMT